MRQGLTQTKEQLKQVTNVWLNWGYLSFSSHLPPSPQLSSENEYNEDDENNYHDIGLDGL